MLFGLKFDLYSLSLCCLFCGFILMFACFGWWLISLDLSLLVFARFACLLVWVWCGLRFCSCLVHLKLELLFCYLAIVIVCVFTGWLFFEWWLVSSTVVLWILNFVVFWVCRLLRFVCGFCVGMDCCFCRFWALVSCCLCCVLCCLAVIWGVFS